MGEETANPMLWYVARHKDAEWWHIGGVTRADAVAKGVAEYDGEPFWISQAKKMTPSFAIFDGDDLCERLGEDECWGEDGWEGEPDAAPKAELERRLEAVFRQWFAEFATMDGAALDAGHSERIEPAAAEQAAS